MFRRMQRGQTKKKEGVSKNSVMLQMHHMIMEQREEMKNMQTQMIRLKFDVGLLKDENTDMRARITALEAQRGADMKKLDSQASKGNDDNDNGVGTFGSSLLPTCEEEEAGDAADGSAQLNKLSLVNSNYNASDRKGGAKAGSKNNPERGVLRQRSPPPLK